MKTTRTRNLYRRGKSLIPGGTQLLSKRPEMFRIKNIVPGGGYIVSSSNSIPSYAKPGNVLAMANAIQKYGQCPITL